MKFLLLSVVLLSAVLTTQAFVINPEDPVHEQKTIYCCRESGSCWLLSDHEDLECPAKAFLAKSVPSEEEGHWFLPLRNNELSVVQDIIHNEKHRRTTDKRENIWSCCSIENVDDCVPFYMFVSPTCPSTHPGKWMSPLQLREAKNRHLEKQKQRRDEDIAALNQKNIHRDESNADFVCLQKHQQKSVSHHDEPDQDPICLYGRAPVVAVNETEVKPLNKWIIRRRIIIDALLNASDTDPLTSVLLVVFDTVLGLSELFYECVRLIMCLALLIVNGWPRIVALFFWVYVIYRALLRLNIIDAETFQRLLHLQLKIQEARRQEEEKEEKKEEGSGDEDNDTVVVGEQDIWVAHESAYIMNEKQEKE